MDQVVSGDTVASSSSTATATPAVTADSSASATPATQGTAPNPITDSTGPLPFERHKAILEGVYKERDKFKSDLDAYREQHGWAESVQRDQLEQMANWYGRYTGDAGEFIETILQESLQHPVHGQSVKSRLGRMLSSLRSQQPAEKIEAGIPVMNDKGEIVARTFTDAQIEQLLEQKLTERFGKELDPLRQDLQSRQQKDQQAALQAKADAALKTAQTWHGFTEHKAEILKVYKANKALSLQDAYLDVLHRVILPGLDQKSQGKVLSDLQQKATAQTVHPGAPSGSAKPKFKNFAEAHAYYETHPEEADAMANR
jgi:hypothetical protein